MSTLQSLWHVSCVSPSSIVKQLLNHSEEYQDTKFGDLVAELNVPKLMERFVGMFHKVVVKWYNLLINSRIIVLQDGMVKNVLKEEKLWSLVVPHNDKLYIHKEDIHIFQIS